MVDEPGASAFPGPLHGTRNFRTPPVSAMVAPAMGFVDSVSAIHSSSAYENNPFEDRSYVERAMIVGNWGAAPQRNYST